MFAVCESNPNVSGHLDLWVATKPMQIMRFNPAANVRAPWSEQEIAFDSLTLGTAKGIAVADIDQDGMTDIVVSCEEASMGRTGVAMLKSNIHQAKNWDLQSISGPVGIKYDLIELYDIDGDFDLDVLTCEEREGGGGLGVIWYENPLR